MWIAIGFRVRIVGMRVGIWLRIGLEARNRINDGRRTGLWLVYRRRGWNGFLDRLARCGLVAWKR
jgi:hypothetical protein